MDNLLLKTDVERMLFMANDGLRERVNFWTTRTAMAEEELQRCQQDAALVIHALECSIILIEKLLINLPSGQPIDPGVATAKGALDRAMAAIHGRPR